jgi:sulfide:quinone oxidoreductase
MTSGGDPSRITVLGAGFGALSTVCELGLRYRVARIALVAPRAALHEPPGIIGTPAGCARAPT